MLETIRELGLERLDSGGALAAAQRAHAHYYLLLAEEAALHEAGREIIGLRLPPNERPRIETAVTALRAALGPVAFEAAWADGRAMTMDEAGAL